MEEGKNDFATGDTSRDLRVELPDEPEGAPLLLAFHWMGGSANQLINAMKLDDLADEEGVIVLAPASGGGAFEWEFLAEPEGNPDLLLMDDMLACAAEQWQVDLDRIYVVGMSAGGLWTSYAAMHWSTWLAAAMPLSGGVTESLWTQPEDPIPVMVTWGGPSDFAVGFDFNAANLTFSSLLQESGSFVVECEHDGGHTIPDGATQMIWAMAKDHPKGISPEPWAGGLPSDLNEICRLPD